jgi:hypothetical protein
MESWPASRWTSHLDANVLSWFLKEWIAQKYQPCLTFIRPCYLVFSILEYFSRVGTMRISQIICFLVRYPIDGQIYFSKVSDMAGRCDRSVVSGSEKGMKIKMLPGSFRFCRYVVPGVLSISVSQSEIRTWVGYSSYRTTPIISSTLCLCARVFRADQGSGREFRCFDRCNKRSWQLA